MPPKDQEPDAADDNNEQLLDAAAASGKQVESQQGHHLWRSVKRAVCLEVNVRAPGVLSRLQAEMRSGHISDEMWNLYLSRVIQPNDERLTSGTSPFTKHPVHYIVHRHRIRITRSFANAKTHSKALQTPLYTVQAHDAVVKPEDARKMTPAVREELLRMVRPDATKGLPGFLHLYEGMRLILNSKDCVRFGVMKGCPCVLRHIVFADDEVLPVAPVGGQPYSLVYMPASLLLQVEGADWTLPPTELPANLPEGVNKKGFFQLRPTFDYLRARHEAEYFSVRRTSFLVMPADTLTVYAAQGSTFDAVIADMQRPPNLDHAKHWLAC